MPWINYFKWQDLGEGRGKIVMVGGEECMGQVMEDLVFQYFCHSGQLQFLLGLLPEIATKSENDKILQTKVGKWRQGGKLFLNPFLFPFFFFSFQHMQTRKNPKGVFLVGKSKILLIWINNHITTLMSSNTYIYK